MKFESYLNENLNEDVFDGTGIVTYKGKDYKITKPVSAKDENDAKEKFKEFFNLTLKNGHFPKETKLKTITIKKP